MISFIVPAHNEQACIEGTLEFIHQSTRTAGQPYEVIVVDDASTDATADVARRHGAEVISIQCRQIAAARNAGARAAQGERYFFIDADTRITSRVVEAASRALDAGAVGGGAPARFRWGAPLHAHILLWYLGMLLRLPSIAGGACMFCTREAFQAVGGFDERLFGAEDVVMSSALNRVGRFVVLWQYVSTSGRRTNGLRGLRMLAGLIGIGFYPRLVKRRSRVRGVWYGREREVGVVETVSLIDRAVNGMMLLVVLAMLPIWGLIPWWLLPSRSLAREACWGMAILSCHFGLVVWPCGYLLLRSLFQQTRWLRRAQLVGLIGACLWFGWGAAKEVVLFWRGI